MALRYDQGYTTGAGSQLTGQIQNKFQEKATQNPETFRQTWLPIAQRIAENDPNLTAEDRERYYAGAQMGFAYYGGSPTAAPPSASATSPGAPGASGATPGGGVGAPGAPSGGATDPSLAGLNTAASNVSGGSGLFTPGEGGETFGPGVALSGPGALRQGIGSRMLPRESMSLAALRRIY